MDAVAWVRNFIEDEKLPDTYQSVAHDYLLPFAQRLTPSIIQHRVQGSAMVIGINGAQGTGKTTFAKFLTSHLSDFHGLKGTNISLDDFYLTRAERMQRAREIHPLFTTRGVPGTHDTAFALSVITKLRTLKSGETLPLPSFDKARDDRREKQDWSVANGQQDFVICEGWCVGSQPEPVSELEPPINHLEEKEDPSGVWRTAVNQFLSEDYQKLFNLNDLLIYLKVPDFETVLKWRGEQESKLKQSAGPDMQQTMSPEQLIHFIQHFERITRNDLRRLPGVADYVFEFDRDHQITSRLDKQLPGR